MLSKSGAHFGSTHCEGSLYFLARRLESIHHAISEGVGIMSALILGDLPVFSITGSIPQREIALTANLFIEHGMPLVQESKRSQVACSATAKNTTILANLVGGVYPQNRHALHLRDLLRKNQFGELVMPFVHMLGGLPLSHVFKSLVTTKLIHARCIL